MQGVIARWDDERGFGWIDNERGRYFMHASAVDESQRDMIRAGLRCTFEPTTAPKGLRAEHVTIEW